MEFKKLLLGLKLKSTWLAAVAANHILSDVVEISTASRVRDIALQKMLFHLE